MTVIFIFYVIAFLCFMLAAARLDHPRVDLVALGLAFFMLTFLIKA